MEAEEIERKKLAKAIDDHKEGRKAANVYWGILLAVPILTLGFSSLAFIAVVILILLSIHIKTRKLVYVLVTISIPIFGLVIGGWIGALVGLGPAIIIALLCAANYAHYTETKSIA